MAIEILLPAIASNDMSPLLTNKQNIFLLHNHVSQSTAQQRNEIFFREILAQNLTNGDKGDCRATKFNKWIMFQRTSRAGKVRESSVIWDDEVAVNTRTSNNMNKR